MNAPPFLSSGGPWGHPPPPPLSLNPNLFLRTSLNLYTYLSNLAYTTYPSFPPNFLPHPKPYLGPNPPFHPPPQPSSLKAKDLLDRIDNAVMGSLRPYYRRGMRVSVEGLLVCDSDTRVSREPHRYKVELSRFQPSYDPAIRPDTDSNLITPNMNSNDSIRPLVSFSV